MELTEAMRTAATIRRFRPDPVPDEVLYRVLDSARFAPSGGNRQGWRVVVVRDQALRKRLKELYLRTWRPLYQALLAQGGRPDAAGRRRPGTAEGNHYAEHMDELPVHLVVIVDSAALLTPFPALNQSPFASGSSIYPFVQNLVLAIRSEGLGTSLTMLLNNEEAEVKQLLDIPDGFALAAHLGWAGRRSPIPLGSAAARLRTSPPLTASAATPFAPATKCQARPDLPGDDAGPLSAVTAGAERLRHKGTESNGREAACLS